LVRTEDEAQQAAEASWKDVIMKIAVAGATGRVGQHVVDVLQERGHNVVAISRSHGVDIVSGKGLDEALRGVTCIIDTASGPSPDQASATDFFRTASENLIAAGQRAGVRRIVAVSIIGIDTFSAGYMAAKVVHEKALRSGPIPVRVLRAAQFHEFVGQIIAWGTQGNVSYVPKMRTQLVAARNVAEVLVDLATADGAFGTRADTSVVEIAGPQPEDLVDAATRLVARYRQTLSIEGVRNASDPDVALYEAGALLPGPDAILAGPTFDEWLATAPVTRADAVATP
jgi:uncharacterized protein YbjT (DUF2867 family)